MFDFLKKNDEDNDRKGANLPAHTTDKENWEHFNKLIYERIIAGGDFCIGVASVGETEPSQLKLRLNMDYPTPEAIRYIRTHFTMEHFAALFKPSDGLSARNTFGLSRVTNRQMGLPLHTLVLSLGHATENNKNSLLLFGGEFLHAHMEARLNTLHKLL